MKQTGYLPGHRIGLEGMAHLLRMKEKEKNGCASLEGRKRNSLVMREQEHDGSFAWWRYHDHGFLRAGLKAYLLLLKNMDQLIIYLKCKKYQQAGDVGTGTG